MLQLLLIGGKHSVAIVWHSHRTTNARLELVHRLCRERLQDQVLTKDIGKAIDKFKGLSRTRNFFCHATYQYDAELNLESAQGATSAQDGYPIIFETKRMDRATLNQISDASIKLGDLNRLLWSLVERLEIALGLQLANRPRLPTEQK